MAHTRLQSLPVLKWEQWPAGLHFPIRGSTHSGPFEWEIKGVNISEPSVPDNANTTGFLECLALKRVIG